MGLLSSSLPPPKIAPQRAMLARIPMAPAMVAATVLTSMCRCLMWASSWAVTPSNSSGVTS